MQQAGTVINTMEGLPGRYWDNKEDANHKMFSKGGFIH